MDTNQTNVINIMTPLNIPNKKPREWFIKRLSTERNAMWKNLVKILEQIIAMINNNIYENGSKICPS